MKLKRINVLLLFLLTLSKLTAQTTADNAPTLNETLEWLKNKINTHCEPYDNGEYGVYDYSDIDYYDWDTDVSSFYTLTVRGKSHFNDNSYMTQSLSLYDITSFNVSYSRTVFYLYSKEKKVHVTTKHRYFSEEEYKTSKEDKTSIVIRIKDANAEANLSGRFIKAFNRLVALNNMNKPKETF
jgi:hypothetical protein